MATQIGGWTEQPGVAERTAAEARKARKASAKRPDTIGRLMRSDVHRVGAHASANDAAQLMWDKDIGSVPVVDEGGKLIGIVTDRDIAMAAYLRGTTLWDIPLTSLMTRDVISARADDPIDDVLSLMSRRQVRRVPIVDDEGALVGIVSINDFALAAGESDGGVTEHAVADALRSICAPRSSAGGEQLREN
jgi:CBS domain-containing protein